MKNKALIPFFILALSGCNTVRIEVPAGATLEPGAIVINQAGSKAQAVSGNKAKSAIEATTTPTTDLSVTP